MGPSAPRRSLPTRFVMDGPARDALGLRLAQGDSDAVAEAYELHHAAVRGFARRLVGDEAVAEDLVHEVFDVRIASKPVTDWVPTAGAGGTDVTFWFVVRDDRGGVTWVERRAHVRR